MLFLTVAMAAATPAIAALVSEAEGNRRIRIHGCRFVIDGRWGISLAIPWRRRVYRAATQKGRQSQNYRHNF